MAAHQQDVEVHGNEKEEQQDFRVERSESLVSLPDPDAGKSEAERAKIVR